MAYRITQIARPKVRYRYYHCILETLTVQKFVRFVSLRTGTEFITFAFNINKVTGFYGFLALFTGFELNWLQLSMYIYSIITLAIGMYLNSHIRQESSLQMLALAWLYVFDTILNTAYAAAFGTGWFKMLALQLSQGGSFNDTAGTGKVVVASHSNHLLPVNDVSDAVAVVPEDGASAGHSPVSPVHPVVAGTVGQALGEDGSFASIAVICLLSLIRVYFCLIVVAYARSVLRRRRTEDDAWMTQRRGSGYTVTGMRDASLLITFKARLGDAMLSFPSRTFWLGDGGDVEDKLRPK